MKNNLGNNFKTNFQKISKEISKKKFKTFENENFVKKTGSVRHDFCRTEPNRTVRFGSAYRTEPNRGSVDHY